MHSIRIGVIFIPAILLFFATTAAALQPDQILLVVNRKLPASAELAHYYAKARLIPDNRILALDLPINEQVSYALYESNVVPVVRQFLRDHKLEKQITCIVTFYGVPLRINAKRNSEAEKNELEQLKVELEVSLKELLPLVEAAEAKAREIDPKFQPAGTGAELQALGQRADAALQAMARQLREIEDIAPQREAARSLLDTALSLASPALAFDQFSRQQFLSLARDDQERAGWLDQRQAMEAAREEMSKLQEERHLAESRQKLRELTKQHLGRFGYARLLETQSNYFDTTSTTAAFDSELALVWWSNYPRQRWQVNPLNFKVAHHPAAPPVLMVSRLDAPEEGIVRDMILASLRAERDGLHGKLVIDGNGSTKPGGDIQRDGAYRQYDQLMHELAGIASKTRMPVTVDDRPTLLPPHSVNDVALYTGWYSLRKYVPSCSFNIGAVAYHTASLELVSLRDPEEKGWCAGLLRDGAAATLGAVAEPYLHAFPAPDQFYPLLLTGKLTLAEAYWKTVPMTSWMIALVGDPLYTPYKSNPVMRVQDLPESMQAVFSESFDPATQDSRPVAH